MSNSVDERIVEMRFNNKQFESNAKTTISTLDKLRSALKLDSAVDSLNNVNDALEKTTNSSSGLSGLSSNVETIANRFTNLGVIATSALATITSQAVSAGASILKSLTVDPIMGGFGEYELKMGSIQTILNSAVDENGLAVTLKDVNDSLDELNTYADRTIYSFSDMTSNIGKFTNAGVSLDSSVAAIQGVANVAAISGANAAQASHAMYNFAQALSSGYVKLIDWKSIENAQMATVNFKDQLLETAAVLGTVEKQADGTYKVLTSNANGSVMDDAISSTRNFNDSLSYQWMTTEVLTQTLSNYSKDIRDMTDAEIEEYETKLRSIGYTEDQIKAIEELGSKAFDSAQEIKTYTQLIDTLTESVGSSWAETFQIILGDFEQAKALWKTIDKIIEPFISLLGVTRNALIKNFATPIRNAIQKIVPVNLLELLEAFGDKIGDLGEAFTASEGTMKDLQTIFEALIKPIEIIIEALSVLLNLLVSLATVITQIIGKVLSVVISGLAKITSLIQPFIDIVDLIVSSIGNLSVADLFDYNKVFDEAGNIVSTVTEKYIGLSQALHDIFVEGGLVANALGQISPILSTSYNKVAATITAITSGMITFFGLFADGWNGVVKTKEVFDEFGITTTTVYEKIGTFAYSLRVCFDMITEAFGKIKNAFTEGWSLLEPKAETTNSFERLTNAVYRLHQSFDNLLQAGIDLFDRILGKLDPLISKIKEIFGITTDDLEYTENQLSGFVAIVMFAIDGIVDGITFIIDILSSAMDFISGISDSINITSITKNDKVFGELTKFQTYFVKATDAITNFDLAVSDFPTYLAKIAEVFKYINPAAAAAAFSTFWYDVFNNLKTNIEKIQWEEIGNLVLEYLTMAFNGIASLATGITDFIANIQWEQAANAIAGSLSKLGDTAVVCLETIVDSIGNAIKNIVNGTFTSVKDELKSDVSDVGTTITGEIDSTKDEIIDNIPGVSEAGSFISDELDSVKDTVVESITGDGDETSQTLEDKIGEIAENAENAITSLGNGMLSFIEKIRDLIAGGISSLFNTLSTPGENGTISGNLFDGIKQEINNLKTEFDNFMKDVNITDILLFINTIFSALTAVSTVFMAKGFKNITGDAGFIVKAFKNITEAVKNFTPTSMINGLKDSLTGMIKEIKPPKILEIAVAVALLAGSMKLLSTIDAEGFDNALKGMITVVGVLATGFLSILGSLIAVTKYMEDVKGFNVKSISSFGVALIAIAGAFLVLAIAMKLLSTIPGTEMMNVMISLTTMVMYMSVMMLALAGFTQIAKPAPIMEAATAMLVIAVALLALTVPCLIFALIPWDMMKKGGLIAFAALVTLFGGIIAFAAVANKNTAKDILALAGSMIIIGFALNMIAAAMIALGMIRMDAVIYLSVIVLIISALIAVGALLDDKQIDNIYMLTDAILRFSAGILVLSAALTVLSMLDPASIANGLSALLALLIVFAGFSALFGCFPELTAGAILLSASFSVFAKACMTLAAAIALVSLSLIALGVAAPIVGAGIQVLAVAISSVLFNLLTSLAAAILGAMQVFATGFIQSAPIFEEAFYNLFTIGIRAAVRAFEDGINLFFDAFDRVYPRLQEEIPKLQETGTQLVEALMTWITAALLAFDLGAVVTALLWTIEQNAESWGRAGASIAIKFISGLVNGVVDNAGTIMETVLNAIGGLVDAVGKVFEGIGDVTSGVADLIKAPFEAVSGLIDSIGQAAYNAGTGFKNLADGAKTLTEIDVVQMAIHIGALAKELPGIVEKGKGLAEVGEGMKNIMLGSVTSLNAFIGLAEIIPRVTEALRGLSDIDTVAYESASAIMDNFLSAMDPYYETVYNKGSEIGHKLAEGVEYAQGAMYDAGMLLVEYVNYGIDDKSSDAWQKGSDLGHKGAEGVRYAFGAMYQAGLYLGDGLLYGMQDKNDSIYWKGYDLGKTAIEGIKRGADEQSPSKAARQAGLYLGEGLIIGMNEMLTSVSNVGYNMGNAAVDSLTSSVSTLSGIESSLDNYSPSLTPVVD